MVTERGMAQLALYKQEWKSYSSRISSYLREVCLERRTEFLAELERLLADLPEEERQAAIQYYEDYLQDAGEENEQEVIRELGAPEKVAATIRADYSGK